MNGGVVTAAWAVPPMETPNVAAIANIAAWMIVGFSIG